MVPRTIGWFRRGHVSESEGALGHPPGSKAGPVCLQPGLAADYSGIGVFRAQEGPSSRVLGNIILDYCICVVQLFIWGIDNLLGGGTATGPRHLLSAVPFMVIALAFQPV